MTREEAETFAERGRAALAELGLTDARVYVRRDWRTEWAVMGDDSIPLDAWFMAGLIAKWPTLICWPCMVLRETTWADPMCTHDPWTSERPRLERAR